jgi:hypothetical protein
MDLLVNLNNGIGHTFVVPVIVSTTTGTFDLISDKVVSNFIAIKMVQSIEDCRSMGCRRAQASINRLDSSGNIQNQYAVDWSSIRSVKDLGDSVHYLPPVQRSRVRLNLCVVRNLESNLCPVDI